MGPKKRYWPKEDPEDGFRKKCKTLRFKVLKTSSKETPEIYSMETLENMSESFLPGVCKILVLLRETDDSGLEPSNPRRCLSCTEAHTVPWQE